MLSSLRTRLVLICVSIVVLSMLALSVANYITTRNSMLASADQQMQQQIGPVKKIAIHHCTQ